MRERTSHARTLFAAALAASLVVGVVPVLAAAPSITGLASSTHPVPTTWYPDGTPAFSWDAASDLPLELSSIETSRAVAVDVAGDVAYVADDVQGLLAVDITDPASPSILGTTPLPNGAEDVTVHGDLAFVAGVFGGLQIFDVSQPGTLTAVGSYNTSGRAMGVAVDGDTAYVSDWSDGLQVIDVSEPGTPTLLASVDTAGNAWDVDVCGDLVFVAGTSSKELKIFDVSDPTSPTVAGTFWAFANYPVGVDVVGHMAYVASSGYGVYAVDVSEPGTPTLVGEVDTPGQARSVEVWGDVAYVADDTGGLFMADVSDPTQPVPLGYGASGSAERVAVAGELALVADDDHGLRIFEASRVTAMVAADTYDPAGSAYGVDVDGDLLYVAHNAGVTVLDSSDPAALTLLDEVSTSGAADLDACGSVVYVADRTAGVKSFDVSDPADPTLLDTFATAHVAYAVVARGDVLYAADYSGGLYALDISDPSNMVLLDTYDPAANHVLGLAVAGDVAYLTNSAPDLTAIDISDPSNMSVLDTYDSAGSGIDVDVAGDVALISSSATVKTIDITDPTALTLLDSYAIGSACYGVAVAGDVGYATSLAGWLQVLDLSDPTDIGWRASSLAATGLYDVAVWGDMVFASGDDLYAFTTSEHPVGYSFSITQSPATVPDAVAETARTSTPDTAIDGTNWFHVRAVGLRGDGGTASHVQFRVDTADPVTASDGVADYVGPASIELSATDAASGVQSIDWELDGVAGSSAASETVVETRKPGDHTLTYRATDAAGNVEATQTLDFTVTSNSTDYTAVAGSNRYDTAIRTSKAAFADGTADAVVIATGENWPDALGGAALAAAKNGPILLTAKAALPSGVISEIRRLGATEAVILGGEGAVSAGVESALEAELGGSNVSRVAGTDRYKTAEAIAQATITELGGAYDGTAFVGTGANFPDALAASPIAAAMGWPIFLANPAGTPPVARMDSLGVSDVFILGGTGVVSAAAETALDDRLGAVHVNRIAGNNRYATGVALAVFGVDSAGLAWDSLALSTGENFPDALAGGILAAENGSVMLLTASNSLPDEVYGTLGAQKDWIADVYYLGGLGAISQAVRDTVATVLH